MAIVYILHVVQQNALEVVRNTVKAHSSYNAAAIEGFTIISDWVNDSDESWSCYDAASVQTFRDAVERQDFCDALDIWNDHLSGNCYVGILKEEYSENNPTDKEAAAAACTVLFFEGEPDYH